MKEIVIGTKTYAFTALTDEVSIDDILRINPTDIAAQALEFPVILHAIGAEKIEQANEVRILQEKLDHLIIEENSRLQDVYKERKANEKLTVAMISDYMDHDMMLNVDINKAKEKLAEAKLGLEYIENLYWSAKTKSFLLQNTRL